ncbi:branched-chain amino acid ABC transporter permease [Pseudorhodoferax sp.]|uniref:branched-chain amino acid ABC transporter permease n=1 Tax=Pseudorhodoferax sp. TaxID=1993553 RepID=UPI0039E402AE
MELFSLSRLLGIALFGVAMCLLPLVVSPALLPEATRIVLLAGGAMALNLLVGATGLISMGMGVFFGLGAYVVAIGVMKFDIGFWQAAGLALAISLPLGLLIAVISLRARHLFFGLLTMAIGQVAFVLVSRNYRLTGGDEGLVGIPIPEWLDSDVVQHYVAVAAMLLVAVVLLRLLASPFGAMLGAVRDNADRVASTGANPKLYEITAMVIAGFLTTLLGVVWAGTEGAVEPQLTAWMTSMMLLMMVALGGRRSFLGPVVGAIVLEASRAWVQSFSPHSDLMVGVLVILCALLFREGIGPRIAQLAPWRRHHDTGTAGAQEGTGA